jgi:DNA-binding NarL/FixJ family response regulator
MAEFAEAQLPMELARSRLDLAGVLITEAPQVALAEARAALATFERLQASRDVDAAGAVLRSLGVRAGPGRRRAGPLSQREGEVLELVGQGLTNPQIAERLYLSRKTVEHHVGNILAKLGLRSRAEAAAYQARGKSAPQ